MSGPAWDDPSMIVSGLGLVVAAGSMVIAVRAMRYARMQGEGTQLQAADTTRLRQIAELQQHEARTPTFAVALVPLNPGPHEDQVATLTISLTGPTGLDGLDELTLTVLDDRERHAIGAGPTEAEVRAMIWAPYRFTPGVDAADEHGRSVSPVS